MKTKHSPRRCMVCRDYAVHQKAQRGPGNWVAKLGTIHLAAGPHPPKCFQLACGRTRKHGQIWAIAPTLVTCKMCKRVDRARRRRDVASSRGAAR